MLLSVEWAERNRRFIWIGETLSRLFYNVKYDLLNAGIGISAEKYLTAAFLSAAIYGLLSSGFIFMLFYLRDSSLNPENYPAALIVGAVLFAIFFFLHIIYLGLMAKKRASGVEEGLLFALKSMLIQVSSGVGLFDSMSNVGKSNYGAISEELEGVVKDISAGESQEKALEKLAISTKSDHLRQVSWQLITAMRSGVSAEGALRGIVNALVAHQIRSIKDYAAELNMWILIYLMIAAAVPTLGITFLVILSGMGGVAVGPSHIFMMVGAAFVLQVLLISFVKTRVPKVYL